MKPFDIDLVSTFNTTYYATIIGLLVGAIVRVINKFVDKDKQELDKDKRELETHIALRRELREELDSVREEFKELQQEVNDWREKYFQQVQLTNKLQADILSLKHELAEYKSNSGNYPVINEPVVDE